MGIVSACPISAFYWHVRLVTLSPMHVCSWLWADWALWTQRGQGPPFASHLESQHLTWAGRMCMRPGHGVRNRRPELHVSTFLPVWPVWTVWRHGHIPVFRRENWKHLLIRNGTWETEEQQEEFTCCFLAWMSRFGANHKLVSGTIQFEMPIIHPSGDVKKVTELGGGGFHGEA